MSIETELKDLRSVNYNVYGGVGTVENALTFDESVAELAGYVRSKLRELGKEIGGEIWKDEQVYQKMINTNPLNELRHGIKMGLRRSRDIVSDVTERMCGGEGAE